tara:strand:+ start:1279 stop:2352 length:1074 start_codon:yes stop_codon:yes gene_type:complete
LFIVISIPFVFYYKDFIIKNGIKKKVLKLMLLMLLFFLIGHISISKDIVLTTVYNNFEYLVKYLFFPFLLFLFIDIREDTSSVERLLKIFEFFFFVNLLAIIIGFFFEIRVFQTYYLGNRFGYKGIYSNSGQTSLFFILMMFYYSHKLLFQGFNKWILLKLLLTISISLLIGTKRIYFFLPILIFYYLFFLNGIRKLNTYKIAGFVVVIGFVFFDKIKLIATNTFSLFYKIYEEKGFISSFTSFRSDLISDIISERVIPKWGFLNYLFGGLGFSHGRSEMGFIDLFLFFGIVGLILYLYFYKIILDFKFSHHFYWFFVSSLTLIVFIADAFILDTNVPILLFLICSYFYLFEKHKYV